jgi:hypothetical protein
MYEITVLKSGDIVAMDMAPTLAKAYDFCGEWREKGYSVEIRLNGVLISEHHPVFIMVIK